MPKVRTQAVTIDADKPAGLLHAFALEAARGGAKSVIAAYVTADGRCEAVRMGNLGDLERAAHGLHASLVAEAQPDAK